LPLAIYSEKGLQKARQMVMQKCYASPLSSKASAPEKTRGGFTATGEGRLVGEVNAGRACDPPALEEGGAEE
jgi:hypothetical protein